MRIARFSVQSSERPPSAPTVAFGVVEGDGDDAAVTAIAGHPFGPIEMSTARFPLGSVRLLAPVLPSKVLGIGRNYADHAAEMGGEVPDEPLVFLKPSTSVVGPGDPVPYPAASEEVHHEAELAIVIGRLCKDVPRARAADVVLGYTCANDVTARDLQRSDSQWARAKGFDGACPLGPWVETGLDLDEVGDLAVTCTVDGELRQAGRTAQLVHDVGSLIAYTSAAMTLLPGDVILTGTPAGVGRVEVGQMMTVTVERIGSLSNRLAGRD